METSSRMTRVRWCALGNVVALAAVLATAFAEVQDRAVSPSVAWFLFLISLLLPYVRIVWLIRNKRLSSGLLLGTAWGAVACFAPLSWIVVANSFGRFPSNSVILFLALSLLLFPIQLILAINARKAYLALKQDTRPAARLTWAIAGAMLYGLGAGFFGLTSLPGRPMPGSNEPAATATLRTLTTAEVVYEATYKSGFTDNLTRLCPPGAGKQPDAGHADLVDPVLCGRGPDGTPLTFTKNGYRFTYIPTGKFGEVKEYTIQADPMVRGSTGLRSFFIDQTAVIRANANAQATASDKPI